MSTGDIFQASRNAWTTNGLQIILGMPARLTPAIFGYSMLYPCTDNYLDHPGVSTADKNRPKYHTRDCGVRRYVPQSTSGVDGMKAAAAA